MKYKIIVVLLCIVLLPICWLYFNGLLIPPPLRLGNKPVTYYKYNLDGPSDEEYVIESNAPIYQLIQSELEKKRRWMPTIVTYVPNEVLETDQMKINCLKQSVTLNIQVNDSGDWGQFICDRDQGFSDLFEQIRKYVETHPEK